jgi:bacillithiol biosynthesis cysteine-adding enzyme BshC
MKAQLDLAQDYMNGAQELRGFFPHDYRHPPDPAFVEKVAKGADSRLVAEIKSYNEALGADEKALQNIEALRDDDSAAVVTGQQPGIFTGPLYTVYKALAAVRLSERYSATLGRRVVPVFWVAGDDHDFEEIRTVRFVDWRGRVRPLSYAFRNAEPGLSAFDIPADSKLLGELVRTFDEETSDHESKEEIVEFLKASLNEEQSLADWFGRLMLRLFRGTGLIVFLPHRRRGRELAADILAEEIKSPGATTKLIQEASARLASLKYKPQIEKKTNETHFFLCANRKRRKVLFERDRYYVPDENLSFSVSDMEGMCRSEPERFSPNAVLRTVVQGTLLPTLDYVGGPGEIAYWAQLGTVFERFGVPMARLHARPRVVLVNRRCAKLMQKHCIDPAQITSGDDDALVDSCSLIEKSSQEETLKETADRIAAEFERYVAQVSAVDVSLGTGARKLRQKVEYALGKLTEKAAGMQHQQTEQLEDEIEELRANLFPLGKPQERVFNIFPYLMESGWGLIPGLLRYIDIDRTDYQAVTI